VSNFFGTVFLLPKVCWVVFFQQLHPSNSTISNINNMKKLLWLIIVLPVFSFAQTIDSAWLADNYVKQEIYIPMRDGVKLFTSVYMPTNNSEKHPILMSRTPYSCAPYGEKNYRTFYTNHYKEYLKEGYIMIIQDVRGRWMSEGEFVDVRPFNPNKKTNTDIDEASDTYDTVDWLVKNLNNNNGNVGVFGISYPGFYSTMAALSNHPAVKAVSPQAPVTDWFIGDDFHHNGAFMLMDGFSFYRGFGRPRPTPTTTQTPSKDIFYSKDNYKFYLETGALTNFTKLMGDSIKFWNDLMNHPNYDAWWKARNARVGAYNVKPAMLTVGGLFDAEDCFGAWATYKAIEQQSPQTKNQIVMGPWFHGQWSGRGSDGSYLGNVKFGSATSTWYAENMEIPFFQYHLKGKGSIDKIAEANIFFTGENSWRQLAQWPPANANNTNFYLAAGGKITGTKPTAKNSFSSYISDPAKPVPYTEDVHFGRTREYMTDDQRFASRRPDVLVFQTEVLENDLTVAGPVIADLVASISTTDADFVVKVIDVFPDDFKYEGTTAQTGRNAPTAVPMGGYQMLVRGEIMRGKFRNSFEQPQAFVPNKPTQVKFTLPDVAHTFKKGHRMMVQIQSSWFPLVDRNPQQFLDIYKATDKDFKKATIQIHHSATQASRLIIPTIR
jgi:putative CocE/NonD family hydrolase